MDKDKAIADLLDVCQEILDLWPKNNSLETRMNDRLAKKVQAVRDLTDQEANSA